MFVLLLGQYKSVPLYGQRLGARNGSVLFSTKYAVNLGTYTNINSLHFRYAVFFWPSNTFSHSQGFYLLLPLPQMLFIPICSWPASASPSGLCSNVISSRSFSWWSDLKLSWWSSTLTLVMALCSMAGSSELTSLFIYSLINRLSGSWE